MVKNRLSLVDYKELADVQSFKKTLFLVSLAIFSTTNLILCMVSIALAANKKTNKFEKVCAKYIAQAIRTYKSPNPDFGPLLASKLPLKKQAAEPCEVDCRPDGGYKVIEVKPILLFQR
jgi:hypothetical protein